MQIIEVHHDPDRVRVVFGEPLELGGPRMSVTFVDGGVGGYAAEFPPGAMTARAMRSIRWGELEDLGRAYLTDKATTYQPATGVPLIDSNLRAFASLDRPGRAGRADLEYAVLADRYVQMCRSSRAPIRDLAESEHLSVAQVRNLIHEARKRGLLTEGRKGRAGGSLTHKGRELILTDLIERSPQLEA